MPTFHITAPDGTVYEVSGPEGSTEAEALAKVRGTIGAKQSEPQEAPRASGANAAGSRDASNEVIPGGGFGAVASGWKNLVPNLVEGAYRGLVQGPGQVVSAIASIPGEMWDAARTPQASEFLVKNSTKPSILKNYNDAVTSQNADTEAQFTQNGGVVSTGAIKIGELGSGFLMTPGGSVPRATTKILETMGRAVKSGAKAGTLGGATSFEPDADTVGKKALWTSAGTILGAALGTIPAVGAGVQTAFRKYLSGPVVADAAKSVDELTNFVPGLKGQLNAAQETGNEGIQKFLNKGAGAMAQKQLAEQTEALQRHLDSLTNLYGEFKPPEEVVAKGQLAMQNVATHMRKARKAIWDGDLAAMRTKVTADRFAMDGVNGTSQVAIELPGLKEGFNEITQDFVNSGGNALVPGIQKIMNEYQQFNGHLSFDSLEHLLRLVTGNSGGILKGGATEEAQRAAGAQLKRVVFQAIDEGDGQSEIGSMLKQMRAGYRVRSKAIEDFENGAAAKILNVEQGSLVSNPDAAVDRILKLPDSEIGKLATVLKTGSPETLSALRSANLRNAYQEATVADAKVGSPTFDLAKFLRLTTGDGKLRAAGLYSEGEQDMLQRNIGAMRTLLSKTSQGANTPEIENTAMAATSFAPAFVTRALFRLAGQGSIDKVLFDPTSYQKFKTVNSLFQSEKWDQAAYLLSSMATKASTADE